MYCPRKTPAHKEVRELIASLRYLPEAILVMSGPFACLLSLLLFTGRI